MEEIRAATGAVMATVACDVATAEGRQARMKANPAERFGDPAEFGEACAFLCSAKTGWITDQNLLSDGSAFPGTR